MSTAEEIAIDQQMTPNAVLQEHPEMRKVFDALFINVSIEGCDHLDEVAWRHGMEIRELLTRLMRSIPDKMHHSEEAGSRGHAHAPFYWLYERRAS